MAEDSRNPVGYPGRGFLQVGCRRHNKAYGIWIQGGALHARGGNAEEQTIATPRKGRNRTVRVESTIGDQVLTTDAYSANDSKFMEMKRSVVLSLFVAAALADP